jgi:hypothetical protein
VETLFAAGNIEIKGNGVENCSSGGIWLIDPQGESLVAHNHITMGALKSPHPTGTGGIAAGYGLFNALEPEGGAVAIMHNQVETGEDQNAIVLRG